MNYYHYTTEERLLEIIESRFIKLSVENIWHKKEKPCAWVSTNQFWENTATKQILDVTGEYRTLTFEEQLKEVGCARIQVNPIGFYTWAKLRHLAKMKPEFADAMEKAGIMQGSNPKEWFGSLYPISIEKWMGIEVFRDGKWIVYAIINHKK